MQGAGEPRCLTPRPRPPSDLTWRLSRPLPRPTQVLPLHHQPTALMGLARPLRRGQNQIQHVGQCAVASAGPGAARAARPAALTCTRPAHDPRACVASQRGDNNITTIGELCRNLLLEIEYPWTSSETILKRFPTMIVRSARRPNAAAAAARWCIHPLGSFVPRFACLTAIGLPSCSCRVCLGPSRKLREEFAKLGVKTTHRNDDERQRRVQGKWYS